MQEKTFRLKKQLTLALLSLVMAFLFGPLAYPASSVLDVNYASGYLYYDGKDYYASLGVTFKITGQDQESGLKNIYYLTDKLKNFILYSAPFGGFITEGKHYIAYKMEDNVGNFSPVKLFEFITDLTPPQAFLTLDQNPTSFNNIAYLSVGNTFRIHASDKLSGVKSIEYTLDNHAFKVYHKEFQLEKNTKSGLHSISFKTTDNVNNVSQTYLFKFFLDPNPPVVNFIIQPAAHVKDNLLIVSPQAQITIYGHDAETEIKEILYSISGAKYKTYKNPLSGLAPGKNVIKAKAMDLAGNESQEKTLVVFVDAAAPEGKFLFDTAQNNRFPIEKAALKTSETKKDEPSIKTELIWGISGNVYDFKTKQPVKELEIWVHNLSDPKQAIIKLTNSQGDFRLQLQKQTRYKIVLQKKGFFDYSIPYATSEKNAGWLTIKKYMKTEVQPVKIKAVIDFGEIYFDSGSYEIGPEAQKTLEKIAAFLLANENIEVDLRAHTDSTGDSKANLLLSEKRAIKAVNYLVQKGISKKRISPKGFGETKIKNRCHKGIICSEEEHAANRRVELLVKKVSKKQSAAQNFYTRYILDDYR